MLHQTYIFLLCSLCLFSSPSFTATATEIKEISSNKIIDNIPRIDLSLFGKNTTRQFSPNNESNEWISPYFWGLFGVSTFFVGIVLFSLIFITPLWIFHKSRICCPNVQFCRATEEKRDGSTSGNAYLALFIGLFLTVFGLVFSFLRSLSLSLVFLW